MNTWLTTILILIPLAGALAVWLLPFRGRGAGLTALGVGIAEFGMWAVALSRMDFGKAGPQFEQRQRWLTDLHISYHVALFPFSLWLVGLAALVLTAAIGFGLWAGRQRPRAYFGLMLLLLGAIVGVFAAQDLVLFYVFFEAMLIPLYVLVGVWGGEGRVPATVKLVIYTMAGSLLMLAAIIVLGLEQHSFDLLDTGTSGSMWIFLGFAAAFAVKAPLFPFHGWLPDAYRKSSPEVAGVLSGVVSKAAAFGFLRIAITKFPGPTHDLRVPILVLATIGLVYGSLLAFRSPDVRGVVAYSSMAQMGLITLGLFAANNLGYNGSVLQMVNHGLVSAAMFLIAGVVELRTGTGEFSKLGGMAKGRPILATLVLVVGMIMLAVPLSSTFASEFLILAGVFQQGWAWGVVGAAGMVLAALYGLRLISAVLHREQGSAVADAHRDVRPAELALLLPLVAGLIALSAWPASVSGRSFGGDNASAAVSAEFRGDTSATTEGTSK